MILYNKVLLLLLLMVVGACDPSSSRATLTITLWLIMIFGNSIRFPLLRNLQSALLITIANPLLRVSFFLGHLLLLLLHFGQQESNEATTRFPLRKRTRRRLSRSRSRRLHLWSLHKGDRITAQSTRTHCPFVAPERICLKKDQTQRRKRKIGSVAKLVPLVQ